jgi:phosphonate transport system substrate-binding protein
MRLSLLLIVCALSQFGYAQRTLSNSRPLVLATHQYADNPRLENIEPFAIHLAEATGIKTSVKSYPTVHALLEAMRKNEIDIAFMNTFGYLLLREITPHYEVSATLNLFRKMLHPFIVV